MKDVWHCPVKHALLVLLRFDPKAIIQKIAPKYDIWNEAGITYAVPGLCA